MGYMNHMLQWVRIAIHLINLGIELIATEKYHGTSTNISQTYKSSLKYYSGGEILKEFKNLFDEEFIQKELDLLMEKNSWTSITVYGENYGGPRMFRKQMGNTYGIDTPKFIVFDVKVTTAKSNETNETNEINKTNTSTVPKSYFLNFYETKAIAETLKLDLVHYVVCPHEITVENTDKIIDWVQEQTDLPSTCPNNTLGKYREGVVVRPIIESVVGKKQDRAICKNLNELFKETKVYGLKWTMDKVSKTPSINIKKKSLVFSKYDEIAEEWITENRGIHVLDSIRSNRDDKVISLKDIRLFLDKIIEDVKEESDGCFDWPQDLKEEKDLKRALGQEASIIFKSLCEEFNYVPPEINNENNENNVNNVNNESS